MSAEGSVIVIASDSEAITELNQDKLKYSWNKRLLRRSTPRNDICLYMVFMKRYISPAVIELRPWVCWIEYKGFWLSYFQPIN